LVIRLEEPRLVLVSRDGIRPLQEGLGKQGMKILQRLRQSPADKEELIRAVSGYQYDPLRHDALIYTALSGLRKALGDQAHWIETRDEGWSLKPDMIWAEENKKPGRISQPRGSNATSPPAEVRLLESDFQSLEADLSLRQSQALQEMKDRPTWEVRSYRDFFHVSPMTAFRDLDDLARKGYLLRVGKGRASCYRLTGRKK
jgi:DNA-binding winged helix-turn-helix (wHTH) protein